MKRCVRYQVKCVLPMVGAIAGFAAVVLLGNLLLGKGENALGHLSQLLSIYLQAFPLVNAMFMLVYGVSLFSTYFNNGLAMGATRKDLFWSAQLGGLMLLAAGWAIQLVFDLIIARMGLGQTGDYWLDIVPGSWNLMLLPVFLLIIAAGGWVGRIMCRRTVLGIVLLVVGILVCMVLLMISVLLYDPLDLQRWGNLTEIVTGISIILFVLAEILLWRESKKVVVK